MPGDPAGKLAGETSNPVDSVPVPSSSHAGAAASAWDVPSPTPCCHRQWVPATRGCTPLSPLRAGEDAGTARVFVFPAMKGAGGVLAGGSHSPRRAAGRGSGITKFQPSAPATYWGCPHAPSARGAARPTHNPRATLSRQCPPCLSFPTHNTKPVLISQQEKPDPAAHRDSHQGSVTISALSPTLSLPQALSPPHITGPGCSQMAPCSHYSHK